MFFSVVKLLIWPATSLKLLHLALRSKRLDTPALEASIESHHLNISQSNCSQGKKHHVVTKMKSLYISITKNFFASII